MLNRVEIKAHHVLAAERNPKLLQLLVDAASRGGDLVEAVRATVARWAPVGATSSPAIASSP